MHASDKAELRKLIEKYGPALVAHAVVVDHLAHNSDSKVQDNWLAFLEHTGWCDSTTNAHNCSLCGEPSGETNYGGDEAKWYLCPGCEGTPEAKAKGFCHG
jgi:hypothetical protein